MLEYGLIYLPYVLLSGLLAIVLERNTQKMLIPQNIFMLYAGLLIVFLPTNKIYETTILMTLGRQDLIHFIDMLKQPGVWVWWMDGIMFSMAYGAQVSYFYWQREQHQIEAAQTARRSNLTLRLTLLQGQLEPYFLLNSLSDIAVFVKDAQRTLATRALARLSDLLRYTLRSSQKNWFSVADEIKFIQDYLELQSLRFADRLQVQWSLDKVDWSEYACPRLLINQLFEHSIREQLEDSIEVCTLQLQFSLKTNCIRVTASYPIPKKFQQQELALNATRERLSILYGKATTLAHHAVAQSVCVVLEFPKTVAGDD